MIKPNRLRKGDKVAIVSPSWGGPSIFTNIYELGLNEIVKLGLEVMEFPSSTKTDDFLNKNPKFRAQDINEAFLNREIKAIFVSIGGDDSLRILPYIDREAILNNPKIIIGYSDTTTLLTYFNQLGLVTFHGPSIMAGFAQCSFVDPDFEEHIQHILFKCEDAYEFLPYNHYHEGYLNWSDESNIGVNEPIVNDGWTWLQGDTIVQGRLFGGCVSVLEMMKSTSYWPDSNFWNNKILFLETSEMKPSPEQIKMILRNYGMQDVYSNISALLIGRPRSYSLDEKDRLNTYCLQVVKEEFGSVELPIISNMDFGHTDPQWILPLGITGEIDCVNRSFKLIESIYSD